PDVHAARLIEQQVPCRQARRLVVNRFATTDGRIAVLDNCAAEVGIACLEEPPLRKAILEAQLIAGIATVDQLPAGMSVVWAQFADHVAESNGPATLGEAVPGTARILV